MRQTLRQHLPAGALLRAYAAAGPPSLEELGQLPGLGPRFQAVRAARAEFLNEAFVGGASAAELQARLGRFYAACAPPALHAETLRRRAEVVRHALAHLLHNPDPLALKADRCLAADGPYRVAGLGPAFWSAVWQALDPERNPAWTLAVQAGLRRLGLARWRTSDSPGRVYSALGAAYGRLRSREPSLTALHLDHFLTLVAGMKGRDLFGGPAGPGATPDLETLIRRERCRTPLRRRLKERGAALAKAREELEAALAAQDGFQILAALAVADPWSGPGAAVDEHSQAEALTLWVGRLWEADDPYEMLDAFWRADPIPAAGAWLPLAVLHLRDPRQFHAWGEPACRGFAVLDDSADSGRSAAERYRLFNEGVARLCEHYRLDPLETTSVLAALGSESPAADVSPPTHRPPGRGNDHATHFGGFCDDTFRFLAELGGNNCRAWMERQRERYRFAVRDPLVELCRALAGRFVEPVLRGEWGWDVETAARSGRALTSVCKNNYGRSDPYHTALWITFYRRGQDKLTRREGEAQLFVRLDASGLSYGLCVGKGAREAGRLFRRNLRDHAGLLTGARARIDESSDIHFADAEPFEAGTPGPHALASLKQGEAEPAERPRTTLAAWTAAKTVPADAPLLRSDELVGDILLTFDRLLPLYACAVEQDPRPVLTRRGGGNPVAGYADGDFRRATFLGNDWLGRARTLLTLKRQLILQGVPGTGKTHVARCLARLLTGGRDDLVRLVQFHPAYSYEEFVEGIKVQTVEVNGRHDISYPVEDGLLCAFAAEAAGRPDEPHVLVIDEINRGNLPRIFGELLYLLEYRGQAVGLPYSRRSFQLPANLYVIGTMNAADRSVALVDQALRRRFSFLDMPPDASVLEHWLRANRPTDGPAFGEAVVALFKRLNARLKNDVGPAAQVGHSFFMVPDLDESRLRIVWEHHVEPLLEEWFAGQPGHTGRYHLEELLADCSDTRRKRQAAEISG